MATVSIIKATYADPGIESLLAPLGGMEQFVKKNEKVLLKMNLLGAKDPEKAVTTHGLCTDCLRRFRPSANPWQATTTVRESSQGRR